ncbi:MAG: DUF2066 domain-containing protein [Woeseiaceae bacterium]
MHSCLRLVAIVLLFASASLSAIELSSLYTVDVPLDAEADDPRAAAYKRGLWEIVVRVTGSELPAEAPFLEELFPVPARYVLQFRPGPDDSLSIAFDGAAIENVLRAAGETVWGPDRPLTLVWLAVDWGQGEREIVAADDPEPVAGASRSIDRNRLLRERVFETASRRGVPVAFPLLDTEDLQKIGFADIWGGFDEQLLQASVRYQTNSILVGRIRPGALHRNRWTHYFGGGRAEWGGEPEDAVNLLADSLAAEFAFAGNAPLETVTLNVSGIDSVTAYGSVQQFLERLTLIEDIEVHAVTGDKIRYEVRLRGGPARLARALEISDILIPIEDFDGPFQPPGDSLEFMYRAPGRNL